MEIQPYLFFEGRCQEAIEFYKQALGAECTAMMRFGDAPESPDGVCCEQAQGVEIRPDRIMHAEMKIGKSTILMSDGMSDKATEFKGMSLSLILDSDEEVRKNFKALAQDGQVVMDLNQTFFASCFGMVADRFGVSWMLLAPAKVPA